MVIAGAGPAGLSAALVLGRACRRVLLCDAGTPRNLGTEAMHGWLGHDGVSPAEFRRQAHGELGRYPLVRFVDRPVDAASALPSGRGFRVDLAGGESVVCRKLLLATGVTDALPDAPGLAELWGRSVHTCPYCDGWELRDAPLAAWGRRRRGVEIARALTAWTHDLVLCTDGPARLAAATGAEPRANDVRIVESPVVRLDGSDGRLDAIVFATGPGSRAARSSSTCRPDRSRRSPPGWGCAPNPRGGASGWSESTTVPGVFVAGDILRDVQLAIVAAAEGCKAAFGINRSLTREDFLHRATGELRIEHPPVEDDTAVADTAAGR